MREIRLARTMSYAPLMVTGWIVHGANLRGILPRLTGLRRAQVPAGREGKSSTLVLDAGSTPLLARSTMTIEVMPLGAKASEVRVRLDYAVKCGILGSLVDALLLNAALSLTLKMMLRNLDMSLCDASTLCP